MRWVPARIYVYFNDEDFFFFYDNRFSFYLLKGNYSCQSKHSPSAPNSENKNATIIYFKINNYLISFKGYFFLFGLSGKLGQ